MPRRPPAHGRRLGEWRTGEVAWSSPGWPVAPRPGQTPMHLGQDGDEVLECLQLGPGQGPAGGQLHPQEVVQPRFQVSRVQLRPGRKRYKVSVGASLFTQVPACWLLPQGDATRGDNAENPRVPAGGRRASERAAPQRPPDPRRTLPAASLTCQTPSKPRLQSCLLCSVFQAMKAISSSHPAMTSNKRRKTIGEASRCEKGEGRAQAQRRASAARPPSTGALWPQVQRSPPSVTPG